MLEDPIRYRQDLTDSYAQMSDGELLELSEKPDDLTDLAQQVLRDELKTRKLEESQAEPDVATVENVPRKIYDLLAGPLANSYLVPSDPDVVSSEEDGGKTREYTWKTRLCDCADVQEARQLSTALERAGIESWVEALPSYAIGVGSPCVLVPADKLEAAREVAARPISQDIIDESKLEVPEFVLPVCPECGAHDPVLRSADPVNDWYCEACGSEWKDPSPSNALA